MDPRETLEKHYSDLLKVIRNICRKHSIEGKEAEDFTSFVVEKLVEDDYRKIREFQGKSSLTTYLYTVVTRLSIDRDRSLTGRWHPSQAARNMGPLAMDLEELVYRRGYSFDSALEILKSRSNPPISDDALERIFHALPVRNRPEKESSVGDASEFPDQDPTPEGHLLIDEKNKVLAKLDSIITEKKTSLGEEDCFILRMKFEDDLKVSEIARRLGRERGEVDRKIKLILVQMKEKILAKGLNINDVMDAIGLTKDI